jgi:hypothetical protein
MTDKHKDLQEAAIRRLYDFGCNVFAKEVPTGNGIADALGVKSSTGNVYYIECKASRSDLICLKQKNVYRNAIGEITQLCYMHAWNSRRAASHTLICKAECSDLGAFVTTSKGTPRR